MTVVAESPLDRLLDLSCTEIERRAALAAPSPSVFDSGASAFRSALGSASTVPVPKRTVPVTQHLAGIGDSALALAVHEAAPELSWVASPRTTDGGSDVALAPINDVRDLGSLTCGLMLLAPNAVYPEHSHPPQEIYLPIAGGGSWRYGGQANFRVLADDALVYNNPGDVHSVVADDEPLLALYILWP